MRIKIFFLAVALFFASISFAQHKNATQSVTLPNPIMFVTQVPMPFDSSTSTAIFCNHKPDVFSVVRGGDLYIIYPDGTLKNLTQLAGYGTASGLQGANSIAVRQPCIHWSGTKALFSMVVGAPASSGAAQPFYWQIYEVTNIGEQQILNLTLLTPEVKDKVLNFLCGVNYVQEGTWEEIGTDIYLIAPKQALVEVAPATPRMNALKN